MKSKKDEELEIKKLIRQERETEEPYDDFDDEDEDEDEDIETEESDGLPYISHQLSFEIALLQESNNLGIDEYIDQLVFAIRLITLAQDGLTFESRAECVRTLTDIIATFQMMRKKK